MLYNLVASGAIRRVCRGVYDYPKYSELLQQQLSPDIDQVAQALKALGPELVDETVIATLHKQLDEAACKLVLKDTVTATGWVYETIKRVCGERGAWQRQSS